MESKKVEGQQVEFLNNLGISVVDGGIEINNLKAHETKIDSCEIIKPGLRKGIIEDYKARHDKIKQTITPHWRRLMAKILGIGLLFILTIFLFVSGTLRSSEDWILGIILFLISIYYLFPKEIVVVSQANAAMAQIKDRARIYASLSEDEKKFFKTFSKEEGADYLGLDRNHRQLYIAIMIARRKVEGLIRKIQNKQGIN